MTDHWVGLKSDLRMQFPTSQSKIALSGMFSWRMRSLINHAGEPFESTISLERPFPIVILDVGDVFYLLGQAKEMANS